MLSLEELMAKATVHADADGRVDMAEVQPLLTRYNFAVIRGLVAPETVRAAKERLRESFRPECDRAATGEHPEELHDNFQKLSIGGAEQSGTYRPRCMRTFYNPIWAEDLYGLREAFRHMAAVRNQVYGFEENFAVDSIEDGFWTAARIHHYPSGGGFLVAHKDDVVPVVQAVEGINGYFQPILVMSKCGEGEDCDFSTGGGFFEHEGQRYYFERACELGDIVMYSGAIVHGVSDIDLHKPFRQDRLEGRLCGFVTLYRHFSRKGQLADYIDMDSTGDRSSSGADEQNGV